MTEPLPELSRLGIGKVLDELLPESVRQHFRRELARVLTGPFECHWWDVPGEYAVPGPHQGGVDRVVLHPDGAITEADW